jgi:hypothetical protein
MRSGPTHVRCHHYPLLLLLLHEQYLLQYKAAAESLAHIYTMMQSISL